METIPKITFVDIERFKIKFFDDPRRRIVFEDSPAHMTVDNPNAKK